MENVELVLSEIRDLRKSSEERAVRVESKLETHESHDDQKFAEIAAIVNQGLGGLGMLKALIIGLGVVEVIFHILEMAAKH